MGRTLSFAAAAVVIVADDVRAARPSESELRFHPEAEPDAAAIVARGSKAALRIEPLTTDGVDVRVERDGDRWTFTAGDRRRADLDWSADRAE